MNKTFNDIRTIFLAALLQEKTVTAVHWFKLQAKKLENNMD